MSLRDGLDQHAQPFKSWISRVSFQLENSKPWLSPKHKNTCYVCINYWQMQSVELPTLSQKLGFLNTEELYIFPVSQGKMCLHAFCNIWK